ncbi:MAG TPA: hypothetical protein VLN59_13040, partial [Burkholderiales bacterium]|nr:hypothetical protein [Burkholderiales bacterium]
GDPVRELHRPKEQVVMATFELVCVRPSFGAPGVSTGRRRITERLPPVDPPATLVSEGENLQETLADARLHAAALS